jgi:molybdate/tungstate transport system substrate-binding protein
MMDQAIGPAFDGSTGYTFTGFSAGSKALGNDILGRTVAADVFISASPTVNAMLEGPSNGSWVSWYASFATSPLKLGYNPSSRFASQLKTKPWYDVVTQPGFLLGRTDPVTDPKGVLAVKALEDAAVADNLPALKRMTGTTSNVYAEQTMVGLLQSRQIDAGFFYATEAAQAGIPTVSLGSPHLQAEYTITVLNRAPHRKAAYRFLSFLFGAQGREIMNHDGLSLLTPLEITGPKHVPASLRSTLDLR